MPSLKQYGTKCVVQFLQSCKSLDFVVVSAGQGILALYKGATPPAIGWAAIDSLLLGSLHNYRLFLLRHAMTEDSPSTGIPRLTLIAHGVAGLFAGLTRWA